jgi:N-acylneuraminate cytidylyltransferase/pseudaminic acid cytidylyltransferase
MENVELRIENNVCIIPARGGSKRIPKKNIKPFCGKPLIAYSIENAKKSKLFDDIIVSTDSNEIAKVALYYGATVRMRPKELADDYTGSGEVIKHVLNELKKEGREYDFCCTIYATAPLLQVEYLQKGLEVLKNNPDAHMAFSVTSMPFPIQRTFKITKDNRCEMFTPKYFSYRSQDLEEAYQDAGQFYWENLDNEFFDIPFGKSSIPIILPRELVQDIDTLEDWNMAEKLYRILYLDKFDEQNLPRENLSDDITLNKR